MEKTYNLGYDLDETDNGELFTVWDMDSDSVTGYFTFAPGVDGDGVRQVGYLLPGRVPVYEDMCVDHA